MTYRDFSEYTNLKDQVLRSFGASDRYSQLLSNLKEFFKDDINSPRRFEQITTIRQLVRVLEIRDVLSHNNVAPLKEIVRGLTNPSELLQKINQYENSQAPTDFVNYYAAETTPSVCVQEPPVQTSHINNNPNCISVQKKQMIIETIIEDIGISWRDLARGLNIKEKIIDDLDEEYKKISQKATYIMDIYNKKADESTWFYDICDALETCRKRELLRKLKKIMVRNI